jgi:hypothetical protein
MHGLRSESPGCANWRTSISELNYLHARRVFPRQSLDSEPYVMMLEGPTLFDTHWRSCFHFSGILLAAGIQLLDAIREGHPLRGADLRRLETLSHSSSFNGC